MKEQQNILTSEVAIIGAGPAGSSASLCLARAGVKHLIFEKGAFPRDKICGDGLSGKVLHQLLQIDEGLLRDMAAREDIFLHSWGVRFVAPNGRDVFVPYKDGRLIKEAPPGFIAARKDFDAFLFNRLDTGFAGIHTKALVKDITLATDGILLQIEENGQPYYCKSKLLIASDGAHSLAAKKLIGLRVPAEHNFAGIRAYYENVPGIHPQNYIELHFTKELLPGYFWIFPLPGNRANVGLTMLSAHIRRRKINLRRLLRQTIDQHPELKERFRTARQVSPLSGWGLPVGSFNYPLSGERFMLTGDAAALIDPFTGEGIGNAILSGRLAARTAARALAANDFSENFLKQYDDAVNTQLAQEFKVNLKIRRLAGYPWLFNYLFNRLQTNQTLQETFSAMFSNLDIRKKLRSPLFYFKLLFG